MRFRGKYGAGRGAALSETALIVGVILIMILGSIQLGVLGYVQMTADAAAFMSSHQVAVGDTSAQAINAASSVFPQIAPGDISMTPAPAPAPTVYVDYGYNDPSGPGNSINNRHGGASMMEPTQMTTTVTKSNVASILGVQLPVEGSMIEPQWLENGAHFDVDNSANYGTNVSSTFQVNYFTGGENTPPYYVGFNYLANCPDAQPWPASQLDCANPVQFRALGVAEHLDDSNWELGNGEVGAGNLAFAQVACHQRVYAELAQFFQFNGGYNTSNPTQSDLTPGVLLDSKGDALAPQSNGDYASWGNGGGGFSASPVVNGSIPGSQADVDIRRIYGWDALVNGGYPPSSYTGVGKFPLPTAGAASIGAPYVYGINC